MNLIPRVPFAVEVHLRNELVVRHTHGDRPEQLFQVIGQLGTASVAFAGGVERHEDPGIPVDLDRFAQKLQLGLVLFDGPLDDLDLLRNSAQLVFFETIELVEAAPGAAEHQALENATHGLEVQAFITIEHQDLAAEGLPQRLHRLRLSGACRAVRVPAVAHVHGLGQGQVTFVRQGGMDQLGHVALIFKGVIKGRLRHVNFGAVVRLAVLQLFEVNPVVFLLYRLADELVEDINIVDQVQDKTFELEGVQDPRVFDQLGVLLQGLELFLLEGRELPLLQGFLAIAPKSDLLR